MSTDSQISLQINKKHTTTDTKYKKFQSMLEEENKEP